MSVSLSLVCDFHGLKFISDSLTCPPGLRKSSVKVKTWVYMCHRLLLCLLWFLQFLQPSAVSGLLALWPLSSFSLLSCPLPLFLFIHLEFWHRRFKITSPPRIVLFGGLLEITPTQTCACALLIIASVLLYGKLWEIGLALSSHCPLSQ